jgi:hypothetical protein
VRDAIEGDVRADVVERGGDDGVELCHPVCRFTVAEGGHVEEEERPYRGPFFSLNTCPDCPRIPFQSPVLDIHLT